MTDPASFRSEFPVLEHVAYLNAGTCGPVPRRAVEAARSRMAWEAEAGRTGSLYWGGMETLAWEVRERLASLVGGEAAEIALTRSTTDGIGLALSCLDLPPGGEVLTADDEHPGLVSALAIAARDRGVTVREVPLERIAAEVTGETALVACSHVSWTTGARAPVAALSEAPVPVLYDGAQAAGAVEVDVRSLGCDFYASGCQKWICGPVGTGFLWVRPERLEQLGVIRPGYDALADPDTQARELAPAPGARRLQPQPPSGPDLAWLLAALSLAEEAGREWMAHQAASRAEELRSRLSGRLEMRPARSTLISFRVTDPEGWVRHLEGKAIAVRAIPGTDLLRAAVGAWTDERDIERLARELGA